MARKKKPAEAGTVEKDARKDTLLDNLASVLVAVLFALFVRTFAVQAFQIPTSSMEDGLLIGDHLLVNKFVFSTEPGWDPPFLPRREIRRFDVVVFKYPEHPEQDFIKRVIGLPGDRIQILDDTVYVNGRAIPENRAVLAERQTSRDGDYQRESRPDAPPYTVYLKLGRGPGRPPTTTREFVVPEGHYFALGDNRDLSLDSRYWGPIPRDYVKGRALLVYWSYEAERDSHVWRGWGYLARQWTDRILNFPTKTRWSRTLRLVR